MINIVIIFLFVILAINCNKLIENYTYKICNQRAPRGLHNKYLVNNHYKRVYNNNWDLYIPCGYKFVEKEITKLLINRNNKLIFGISGSDKIASKNNLWNILKDYYGRYEASNIMPETYIPTISSDIILFKKNYSHQKTYILKKNLQRKLGIKLMRNNNNIIDYCKKNNFVLIQEYIQNPFLVNGYKLNLRLFMLVICHNNKKNIYIHKSGKCLYTVQKYDNNLNFNSNITSYLSNKHIYDTNPLSFEQFRMYLLKKNIDDIQVFKKIKNIMVKLATAIQNHICNFDKLSQIRTFQLFGVDIILDHKLNPKLLEINKGPNMFPVNKDDSQIKQSIYRDLYDKAHAVESPINGFDKLI